MIAPAPLEPSHPTAGMAPAARARDDGPRGAVSGLEELLERQAEEAQALSGARTSAWNGTVVWLPRPGHHERRGIVGIADWDGTILYDRDYVQRPLLTLFEKAGGRLEGYELYRAKNALAVVLHENCHLLASNPGDHAATRAQWSWPLVMLEEGTAELFTQTRLNDYVRRLGLDQLAPEVREVQIQSTYPLFVPAVETLVDGVGRLVREPGREVLRKLICEAGGKKFQRLGEIVIDGSGLADRVPADHREAVSEELANQVREAFGEVARMGPYFSPQLSSRVSRSVGRTALRGILTRLEDLDARYPGEGLPATMGALRTRPVLPPGLGASRQAHRRPALDAASARAAAGLTR